MMPLFDMMAQAQNGKLLETFSAQMGLAQEQMAKAMAALTPAFSTGFKRTAADPVDFAALIGSLASGNYSKYFEDLNAAFSPQGIADGNKMLGQLFGSTDATKAIAEQAAQFSGVGQQVLAAMMPAMASTMAGGLFKQMTGQMPNFSASAGNPMLDMMNSWMQATGIQPRQKAKAPDMFNNPFTQAMQSIFSGSQNKGQAEIPDPFGTMAFMKTMQAAMTGEGAKKKEEPKAVDLSQYTEMFNTMFDSGLEVQKSYQKSMESILDSYLKGSDEKSPDET